TFGWGDVRITTRFEPDNPMATLFSTLHESGHAMYEQGQNPAFERTPLFGGTSLAVHESQSRMWENLVGRSLPFWAHFFPALKMISPARLDGVGLRAWFTAIHRSGTWFIRVNAAEASGNMHTMLRPALAIAMVEGAVAIKGLPAIWHEKMR